MEYKVLNNGLKMPMVGLGVYNVSEKETQRVVEDAISVGYRSIDTAAMYYNEKGVGDAVRACGVPREELFITTKICDSCYTKEETLRTVDHSMKQLGLDYVDLMLIHWPVGNPTVMWHTLEDLYKQGMFKAICADVLLYFSPILSKDLFLKMLFLPSANGLHASKAVSYGFRYSSIFRCW